MPAAIKVGRHHDLPARDSRGLSMGMARLPRPRHNMVQDYGQPAARNMYFISAVMRFLGSKCNIEPCRLLLEEPGEIV